MSASHNDWPVNVAWWTPILVSGESRSQAVGVFLRAGSQRGIFKSFGAYWAAASKQYGIHGPKVKSTLSPCRIMYSCRLRLTALALVSLFFGDRRLLSSSITVDRSYKAAWRISFSTALISSNKGISALAALAVVTAVKKTILYLECEKNLIHTKGDCIIVSKMCVFFGWNLSLHTLKLKLNGFTSLLAKR